MADALALLIRHWRRDHPVAQLVVFILIWTALFDLVIGPLNRLEHPYAALIVLKVAILGVVSWYAAGLPVRAAYSTARRVRCLLAEEPDQRSAGSTVLRVPLAAVSAPRRLSLSD